MRTGAPVAVGGVSLGVTSAQGHPGAALCQHMAGKREETRKKQKRTVQGKNITFRMPSFFFLNCWSLSTGKLEN